MEKHQIQHQISDKSNYELPGLWDKSWVRPFESLWSILNTYKAVNVINNHSAAMKAIGMNMKAKVVNEYFLPYGIFCNLSSNKNDIDGIVSKLTPEWYSQQFNNIFFKENIALFFSDKIAYCPECMKNGYHSVLHQLKGMKNCPFHPKVSLVSYLNQRYTLGQQSAYDSGRAAINRDKIFFLKELRINPINFEDISVIPLPSEWNEIPEIVKYLKTGGFRDDFDYIKPIGSDITNKDIIPEIGTFLLKDNKQIPDIILYNAEFSDKIITEKINIRAKKCGLIYKNMSNFIYRKMFKYTFLQITIVEMLKPFTADEIDYKCYQIERGRFITYDDELGVKLLFLMYLIGGERVEECLNIIKENNNMIFRDKTNYDYIPSDICICDIVIDNLCVSAQYYILDEYIRINWQKYKQYIKDINGIKKSYNHKDMILFPIHIIYVEKNKTIQIYRL